MIHKYSQNIIYTAAVNCQYLKISNYFFNLQLNTDPNPSDPIKPRIIVKFANSGYSCIITITKEGVKKKQYLKVDSSMEYRIIIAYKTIIYGDITYLSYYDSYEGSPGLTKLNTDELPNLKFLSVSSPNVLEEVQIDVSRNTKLQTLIYSKGNEATIGKQSKLNLSNNTELSVLKIGNIALTKLDLSKNTELKDLLCYKTKLTGLSLTKNVNLQTLYCEGNNELTKLECRSEVLESLTLMKNPAITTINISKSKLTSISLDDCTELNKLTCKNGKLIGSIDLSKNTKLKEIYLQNNRLEEITLPSAPSADNMTLTSINVENNQLSAIEVYPYIGLKKLNCSGNQLTALNVGKNVALQELICSNNALAYADCGALENLTRLECYGNELQELDITNAVALAKLIVANASYTAELLQTIMCYNTSAAAYSSLNDGFDYYAAGGKLTTDDTEASAELRATAVAKGWNVIVEPIEN